MSPTSDLTESAVLADAWSAVDQWLDLQVPVETARLEGWGLHLWDARRRAGPGATQQLRENVASQLTGERTLRLAREALDGQMVLIKGLALAPLWPEPACRPAGDVDVLVPDADTAWEVLRGQGWTPVDRRPFTRADHWHAHGLVPPGGGTELELHRRSPCPSVLYYSGGGAPTSELLARSRPGPSSICAGVDVPDPIDHALIVAGSSWGGRPFERLYQLVDVFLLQASLDRSDLQNQAAAAGLGRLWANVSGAATSLFTNQEPPLSFRLLGRSLRRGHQPDPRLERPLRLAGGFFIASPRQLTHAYARRRRARAGARLG
jgi:hypothetical protein